MKLSQGAARAIRNLSTTTSPSLTSQEAHEMHPVLSYVVRFVDRADVVTTP